MKRQSTLRSSSSGREAADHQTSTVHHVANSVGCMAGVFQLFSSKYRTRRKFLTFGRKQQEKKSTPISFSLRQSKPNSPSRKCKGENREREASREIRRSSCDVPRSPTIPPELRRSNSLNSPEAFSSPIPSAVARLMGLEDKPPPPVSVAPSPPPESAIEKRRKLLGALEKCDEDLQALKRIIESVRFTDRSKTPPVVSISNGAGVVAMENCPDPMNGGIDDPEQPSPVSVLEDFSESSPPSSAGDWRSSKFTQNDFSRIERVSPMQLQRKKPREDDNNNNRMGVPRIDRKTDWTISLPRSIGWSMDEAVDEVCRDVETGQEREIERVGVMFEDFIYRDLIEEMAMDFMGRCHVEYRLPFDKCKRKLCF